MTAVALAASRWHDVQAVDDDLRKSVRESDDAAVEDSECSEVEDDASDCPEVDR